MAPSSEEMHTAFLKQLDTSIELIRRSFQKTMDHLVTDAEERVGKQQALLYAARLRVEALEGDLVRAQAATEEACRTSDELRARIAGLDRDLLDVERLRMRLHELEEENAYFKKVSRVVILQNENTKLREELTALKQRCSQFATRDKCE